MADTNGLTFLDMVAESTNAGATDTGGSWTELMPNAESDVPELDFGDLEAPGRTCPDRTLLKKLPHTHHDAESPGRMAVLAKRAGKPLVRDFLALPTYTIDESAPSVYGE